MVFLNDNIIGYRNVLGKGVDIYVKCDKCQNRSKKIIELRESTGMNRKEFCEYFRIPYRTVTEWERDNRHAPEYVLRLLEYYIQMEKLDNRKNN